MSTARRVLIVEDNDTDADIAERRMRRARSYLHIDRVRDGDEAMEFLRDPSKPKPDLILLDLNMPSKDGREVLAEMMVDPELHRIPVIVMTTSDLEADRNRAYALSANAYVVKPGDTTEYARVMDDVDRFWLDTNRFPVP